MKTQIRISDEDVEGFLLEDRFNLEKGQTWRESPLSGDALVAASSRLNDVDEALQSAPVTIHVLRFIVEDGTWVFAFWKWREDRESLLVPRYFVKATEQGGDEEEDAHWGTLHGADDENIAGPKATPVEYVKRPHRIEEQDLWQREHQGAKPSALNTDKREYGCLTIFADFQKVLCNKTPYDLTDATQARELLRFLCSEKAQSASTARSKADILKALKTSGGTVASDWRPAHVFRGKLDQLYRDAIGRNTTKGLYWINPQ